MTTSITRNSLYGRQVTLLGEKAQQSLEEARILVIGAGGLGCPSLQYLAAAGIGELGLVDFDVVSASNLQRQILYTVTDIGKPKVQVAREALLSLAPFCRINCYQTALTAENADEILQGYDIVLDCTDNFNSKFLIHDTCFRLRKVLVQASVYQYEGQLSVFDFRTGLGPCLRCLWQEEPLDGCTGTCAEVGVLGPLLGAIGSLMASESIKVLSGNEHLKNGEVLFMDLLSPCMDNRKFAQNEKCPCCVGHLQELRPVLEITMPSELSSYVIVDVRSNAEFRTCDFIKGLQKSQEIVNIPLEQIEGFVPERNRRYLTLCARGIRSLKACRILRQKHNDVFSLVGGIQSNKGFNAYE